MALLTLKFPDTAATPQTSFLILLLPLSKWTSVLLLAQVARSAPFAGLLTNPLISYPKKWYYRIKWFNTIKRQ
ncbi:hypothetical protein RJ641_032688 [Dillenia turbinata]|uniref:Uncharacterized protein n=1 Tax=Dillenia turbinata TaxID=194707 RepID=A0AAN8ZFB3_9MAGN